MEPSSYQINSVPIEVASIILAALSSHPQDLCSAALVSHSFRAEAQRVLFADPTPALFDVCHRHVKFLSNVILYPELALLVRKYEQNSVRASALGQRGDMDEFLNATIAEHTPAALRAMKNLKYLYYASSTNQPSVHILRGCTFSLDGFGWGCQKEEFALMTQFLSTQNELKHIELDRTDARVFLGTEEDVRRLLAAAGAICPKLQSLTGSFGTVALFLLHSALEDHPRHSVKKLVWKGSYQDTEDFCLHALPFAAPGLRRLEYLSFEGINTVSLGSIVGFLGSLILLQVDQCDPNVFPLLKNIPKLKFLILSDYQYPMTTNDAKEIFAYCKHLRELDVNLSWGDPFYRYYLLAGDRDPNNLDMCEVHHDLVLSWRYNIPPLYTFD